MKVLLTGATGFLGKRILEKLVNDSKVSKIVIASRQKITHPSPKVKVVQCDLSDVNAVSSLLEPASQDIRTIIHLAGLYDFRVGYAANYQSNVVATQNVIYLARKSNATVYFASSYSISLGLNCDLEEKPMTAVTESYRSAYACTKGIAERALLDSGIPAKIFRLGILVGDTETGMIEKLDGPYVLMDILAKMQKSGLGMATPILPVPARKGFAFPIVPVDIAAAVFHDAIFNPQIAANTENEIFGVYDNESITIDGFIESVVKRYLKRTRTVFIEKLPSALENLEHVILKGGLSVFKFSLHPTRLENRNFKSKFRKIRIPAFKTYEESFFNGFTEYLKDNSDGSSSHARH